MAEAQFPKIWFRDAKALHYVFLPRMFFMFLGAAAAVLYSETAGTTVSGFLYSVTGIDSNLSSVMIPPILMLAAGFSLMIAHSHKYNRLLAEELRDLTEPAGWKETLVSEDPSSLFQRVADTCKTLGFQQAAMIPGETFLAIRTQHYGLGSLDVVELRPGPEGSFALVARPLFPSRVAQSRYEKIIEEVKRRMS